MFKTNLDLAIESKQSQLQVKFKTFTANDMMKVTLNDGQVKQFDRDSFAGMKNTYYLRPQ